ncbi:hypothetical protein [Psychroflexus halocasei]|nr:hypothetical protein [Psychroflexus halocasei]
MNRFKFIAFLTFCFYTFVIQAQFTFLNIKGEWVSDHNQVIVIKQWANSHDNYLVKSNGEELEVLLVIDEEILSFQNNYFKGSKFYNDQYNFHLKDVTKNKLVLKPTSALAKSYFKSDHKIEFIKRRDTESLDFDFESLIFEKTVSDLNNYKLEINDKKEVIFIEYKYKYLKSDNGQFELDKNGFRIKEIDTIAENKFLLNNNQYQNLLRKLKEARINTLNSQTLVKCGHCYPQSLVVNFNNKTFKHIDFDIPPYLLKDLVDYLKSLKSIVKD